MEAPSWLRNLNPDSESITDDPVEKNQLIQNISNPMYGNIYRTVLEDQDDDL